MNDQAKTNAELLKEISVLTKKIKKLEKTETADKRAEEALQKSEKYFKEITENSSYIIIITAKNGDIKYCSRSIERFTGYKPEELIGRSALTLIHPNDKKRAAGDFGNAILAIDSAIPNAFRIVHKDGSERYFEGLGKNLLDNPAVTGFIMNVHDITEHKLTEEALRRSEEKYRSIIANMQDGYFENDLAGNFTFVNDALCGILGYPREELIGKNNRQYTDEKTAEKIYQVYNRIYRTGEPNKGIEEEYIRKDGIKVFAELSVSLISDAESKPIGFRGIARDVTERKRAEKALRESEDKYKSLVDNVPDIIFTIDLEGKITFVSQRTKEILGYEKAEMINMNILNFIPEEDRQRAIESLQKGMTGEKITNFQIPIITKSGERLFFECSFSRVYKDGAVVGAQGTAVDITERKHAEEDLRKSEERYRTILEDIDEGYYENDLAGNFTFVNDAECRDLGYSREELIGMNYRQYSDEATAKSLYELFNNIYTTGKPVKRFLGQFISKDGTRHFNEVSASLIRNAKGEPIGFRGVSQDITARKQAEKVLLETQKLLQDAYRLAEIGVWNWNFADKMITWSEELYRIAGQKFQQLGFRDTQHPPIYTRKSWELLKKAVNDCLKTGKPYQVELEVVHPDGSTRWLNWISGVVYDDSGKIIGMHGTAQNITERKLAESQRSAALEELRLSEERFRRIFDQGHFGMTLANSDYTIVMANKAFCELLGYNEQELVGQNLIDLTYEEDSEKSREFAGQLFAGSIPVFRMEKRYVKKDGAILWANITASAIHGKEGNVLYCLVIIEDLTESKKAAEKIHLLHYYDSLTGLPNRTFHKELMKRSIEHAQRHKEIFALIYIGLDNFQRINDTFGNGIGDLLMKAVADRLANSLRKSDYVARSNEGETANVVSRVGGDEFIVLAHDLNHAQDAVIASRRLLREISAPYDLSGREVFMTASIGIALYPEDGADVDDLLKNAEKAMRYTKNEGKNNYQFYSESMNSFVLERLTLESDLHKALERDELVLYYQPKVDTSTRMVKGMEALIRWKHPDKGLIPPMQFIPLAETSGLIIPIGEFVIRTVCRQIKTWQEAGYKQISISLNVSGRQFDQQNLIEIVKDALQDTMISPQCLDVEVTESTIMRNPEKALRILTELKAMGIGISIDDFGTGYSSLSYLKRLPLDFLKIDQSFVKSLASDSRDQAIVRATIAMAHSLNLKTIAEGVETKEQLSFLQEHGCDEIQGYLFSRPLPAEEIPGILAKGYL